MCAFSAIILGMRRFELCSLFVGSVGQSTSILLVKKLHAVEGCLQILCFVLLALTRKIDSVGLSRKSFKNVI